MIKYAYVVPEEEAGFTEYIEITLSYEEESNKKL